MDFLSLDPLLRRALEEDLGRGDITTDSILGSDPRGSRMAEARVVAREKFVLAGYPVFLRMFELLASAERPPAGRPLGTSWGGRPMDDAQVCFQEGEEVDASTIGSIKGEAAVLLRAERVALNLLQRMCGIATQTRKFVDLVTHTQAVILDTRKTTPLWRSLEKYAVRMGGGQNHRLGLDDGILIKENHIAIAGGIPEALRACVAETHHLHKVEIELQDLDQIEVAIREGADVILLDNMTPEQVRHAVVQVNKRCPLEVSGGISEQNIVEYAETGVDFISLGALTHSYRLPDISLLIAPA